MALNIAINHMSVRAGRRRPFTVAELKFAVAHNHEYDGDEQEEEEGDFSENINEMT